MLSFVEVDRSHRITRVCLKILDFSPEDSWSGFRTRYEDLPRLLHAFRFNKAYDKA